MEIASLVQMSHSLEEAFHFPLSVQEVPLEKYEKRASIALICSLVGVGITEVESTVRKVGRVMSFEVVPFEKKDPSIIVCQEMNLTKYYDIWGAMVGERKSWNGYDYDHFLFNKRNFEDAIRTAIRSAKTLSKEEITFAIVEMLTFQNEMMCR